MGFSISSLWSFGKKPQPAKKEPAVAAEVPEAPTFIDVGVPKAKSINVILVVDDSPTERFLLTDILTKHGYEVITADNGEAGVVKAKEVIPDLIVMDVVMPGLNGYQAARSISRDEETKHIPIVMCTTKGQDTDKIWGMRQGAKDYVVKPVNPTELLSKIAALG